MDLRFLIADVTDVPMDVLASLSQRYPLTHTPTHAQCHAHTLTGNAIFSGVLRSSVPSKGDLTRVEVSSVLPLSQF